MSRLVDRLVAVHTSLDAAAIRHAFGGAIALAYCTEEPRGTRDLDVNVFVPPEEADRVFAALPDGVASSGEDLAAATRDGQIRLWWDDTPIDLFFGVHAFHRHVAVAVRMVPFEDVEIPVLDCNALTVFKAFYNRTRDWADIEAMIDAGALDGGDAAVWVQDLLGRKSRPAVRLSELLTRRRGASAEDQLS